MKAYAAWLRKGAIAVGGALGALAVALTDISPAGSAVTPAEWVQVALAALVAAGVVATKNGPKPE